jgi:hypothetical protein
MRTRQVPPVLPSRTAIQQYLQSRNRLLILVKPQFFSIDIVCTGINWGAVMHKQLIYSLIVTYLQGETLHRNVFVFLAF